jgi:CRISPR-associated protein Cst1
VAIVIYPQSWLHNANVYGFLKVINEKSKEGKISFGVMDILKDDGTVVLLDEMLEELYKPCKYGNEEIPAIFAFNLEETERLSGEGKALSYFRGKSYYENYLNPSRPSEWFYEAARYIFREPVLEGSESCFLCGNPLQPEESEYKDLKRFSRMLFGDLATSEETFPNRFWDMSNKFYLCDLCSQLALFRHFVFPKNSNKEIFVNVPSFKAIWYLNEAIKAYRDLNIELSVSRAVAEVHMKLQRLLGVWERQNIEIVNYDGESYSVYYVPQRTVDLLLNTRISSILNSINSIKIFETVIYPERLNKLIEVEYFLLKYFLNPGDDSKIKEYIEVFDPKKKRYYAWMIPELFQEVRNTLGVETVVPVWKMRELGREVSQLFERTRYRLLELIRLAKKDEVYHLLLKTYMANKKPFPEELNRVFSENDENFKNLMFAYVSGIISGGEENE